jgi:multiple sugar transport system permease protein
VFFAAPILYAVWQSLFTTSRQGLLGTPRTVFSGFTNYVSAFTDHGFVASLGRIGLIGIVQVPVMIALALFLALLIDSAAARLRGFFRTLYFIPYGVPGVVAAILWGGLYAPQLSPIVPFLRKLGIGADFLSSNATLWAIANILLWTFAGYNVLILLAQLQSVPAELYESARIDGASEWRVAWNIKLPLVRPALTLVTVFSIIGTLQLFAEPLILQPIDGNISSDYTPTMSAYTEAFTNNDHHLAGAEAVVIAVIALILSLSFLKLSQHGEAKQ